MPCEVSGGGEKVSAPPRVTTNENAENLEINAITAFQLNYAVSAFFADKGGMPDSKLAFSPSDGNLIT